MENLKIQMLANGLYDEEHYDLALEKERILEHYKKQGRATATPNCRCRRVAQTPPNMFHSPFFARFFRHTFFY